MARPFSISWSSASAGCNPRLLASEDGRSTQETACAVLSQYQWLQRLTRAFFCIVERQMVLLHGFMQ